MVWDDEAWEVTDETSEEAGDVLQLEDSLNTVYFESYEGFEGNAVDCIAAETDELAEQDAESIVVGTDSDGDEISGGDAASAYSVFTCTFTLEADVVLDLVEYNERRRLSDEAVLEVSQLTVREAYNDASPAVQNLLAAITLPGEEPVDEPIDTSGDDSRLANFIGDPPRITASDEGSHGMGS